MSVVEQTYVECPLTPGELRVLELLKEGLSYQEIATALGRTTSTVRSHLNSAYHRLGVGTSYQAVLACVRAGWLAWGGDDLDRGALLRIESLLRELIEAVESHHEREELTATQRDYLEHLDAHLFAGDDHQRRAARGAMDLALGAMLREAQVDVAGGRGPAELVADLGAMVTRVG